MVCPCSVPGRCVSPVAPVFTRRTRCHCHPTQCVVALSFTCYPLDCCGLYYQVGGIFDGQLALRQLRYAGLFEAIRIRKSGYAYRATFRVFANSYQILVDGMTKKRESNSMDDQECCRAILAQVTAGGGPHMTALHTLSDFVVQLL
jgi:hypothetical protein